MIANIPDTNKKRIVIIGGGFAGLKLARKINKNKFQIVLIDKNNFHQFQPLFYQVATSGLEPSSISFPLRKVFQSNKNIHLRITEVININSQDNEVVTLIGNIKYDYLVIATGAISNFFGMQNIQQNSLSMKTISDALNIRNIVLQNFEDAINTTDIDDRTGLMNIVIVGGGPTGVELAGALAEMKKFVLPKDYPELDFLPMKIYLVEASPKLLANMSDNASEKSKKYLEKLDVTILNNTQVINFDGRNVVLKNEIKIRSNTLIWAAGIKGNVINGLNPNAINKANRIKVDKYNKVEGYNNIFALGDVACMIDDNYPNGHPQIAQVAIQQAKFFSQNILNIINDKPLKSFSYKDMGTMATIGRNLAVVDFPFIRFSGLFAWFVWMFVHLMAIVGVKNRLLIFINWFWSYITYDQSLRLILWSKKK